nr:SH3 domain-containing protein [Herpetosiphon giganteus]
MLHRFILGFCLLIVIGCGGASTTLVPTTSTQSKLSASTARPQRSPATARPAPTSTPEPTALVVSVPATSNLRQGPSTRYDVITKIAPSDAITILAQRTVYDELWYHVKVGDYDGWMSASLFDVSSEQQAVLTLDRSDLPRLPTVVPTARPRPTARPASNSGQRVGAICRDGSRSYATGRGACSHHGGVDHWLYGP